MAFASRQDVSVGPCVVSGVNLYQVKKIDKDVISVASIRESPSKLSSISVGAVAKSEA